MPALVEVVDQHPAQELGGLAGAVTVLELLEGVVDRVIGHLAADDARLGLRAREEAPQSRLQLLFLLHDEARAFVVTHIGGVGAEGFETVVLVVARRWIGHAQRIHELRRALLGGNQIDTASPPPDVVRACIGCQRGRLLRRLRRLHARFGRRRRETRIGSGKRRRRPEVALDELRFRAVAAIVFDLEQHGPVRAVAQIGVD